MRKDSCVNPILPAPVCMFLVLVLVVLSACEESITIVEYDPERAWNGYTYCSTWEADRILGVDMDGTVVWDFDVSGDLNIGDATGFRYHDGQVAYISSNRPMLVNVEDQTILFEGPRESAHHSIVMPDQGSLMYLAMDCFDIDDPSWYTGCICGDMIREIDMDTREIVWEWRLRDHLDPIEHHNSNRIGINFLDGCLVWSHGNTVKFLPQYYYEGQEYQAVLYNALRLQSIWMIDYATGEVLWSCGQHGSFGRREPPEEAFMAGTHDVDMLENDVFIMYDNGVFRTPQESRALKIQVDPVAGTVEELWSWGLPGKYDWFGGDADELPNGNVVLTRVTRGRIIEVTSDGDIVWDIRFWRRIGLPFSVYQLQRIPYE